MNLRLHADDPATMSDTIPFPRASEPCRLRLVGTDHDFGFDLDAERALEMAELSLERVLRAFSSGIDDDGPRAA